MTRSSLMLLIVAAVATLAGCRSSRPDRDLPATRPAPEPMSLGEAMRLIDDREPWSDHAILNIPRHPAEKHLAGMIIVLDPGHGGEDGGDNSKQPPGYKAGPTGVKEAHMNLRVAHLLRRLLTDAGATVVMTREGDDTIDLRERAEVANNLERPDGGRGADLFISIHHNAVGNRETNYTSVWYHGSVDNNEVELDVAKYVGHALGREMRTDVARTSPLLSSQLMYPSGFGVLRACRVPAILLECSFYTNPAEEQRLRDAGYNLREAYGIYVGLCEYAYGGRPTQSAPVASRSGSTIRITSILDEGLPKWWGADRPRIVSSTIAVLMDGQRVPFEYDEQTKELTATLPVEQVSELRNKFVLQWRREAYRKRQATRGAATQTTESEAAEPDGVIFEIHHANMFKHHNWPQRYRLRVPGEGGESATLEPLPPVRDSARRPQPTTGRSGGTTGPTRSAR